MLEEFHISSGLGVPWDPSGGAGKHFWVEEHLEYLAQLASPYNLTPDKQIKKGMDKAMSYFTNDMKT